MASAAFRLTFSGAGSIGSLVLSQELEGGIPVDDRDDARRYRPSIG